MGYLLDFRGSIPGKGNRFFLYSTTSRAALGPYPVDTVASFS
jgi:hypothetical protein